MAAVLFVILLLQTLIQHQRMVGEELDESTQERMQLRAYYLSRKMTQMLQELQHQEQRIQLKVIQEQCGFAWGALLCTALQQWHVCIIAAVLVLLCGLCWWLRRRTSEAASSSKHGGCRSLEEEEEKDPFHREGDVDKYMSWPLPNSKAACRVVEDLVNELLCVRQMLSNSDFMPQLQTPVRLGSFQEGVRHCGEEQFVYRLLVPLEPPPGHSFHLKLGTEGEMPLRNSHLRVQLECMCREDRQPGDMLCFLHHSEDLLTSTQKASLLQTLCTSPVP